MESFPFLSQISPVLFTHSLRFIKKKKNPAPVEWLLFTDIQSMLHNLICEGVKPWCSSSKWQIQQ